MRLVTGFVGNVVEMKENMFVGRTAAFVSGLESNSGCCER